MNWDGAPVAAIVRLPELLVTEMLAPALRSFSVSTVEVALSLVLNSLWNPAHVDVALKRESQKLLAPVPCRRVLTVRVSTLVVVELRVVMRPPVAKRLSIFVVVALSTEILDAPLTKSCLPTKRSPACRLKEGLVAPTTNDAEVVAAPETVSWVVEARPVLVTKNGALVSLPPMAKEAVVEVGAIMF